MYNTIIYFLKLKYFSYILNITRNLNQIIKYTAITSNQKIDNNLKLDIDLSLARMLPDNYRTEKHYLSWRKMINKFTWETIKTYCWLLVYKKRHLIPWAQAQHPLRCQDANVLDIWLVLVNAIFCSNKF